MKNKWLSGVNSIEVVQLLKLIANEELTIELQDPKIHWEHDFSGNISFKAGDWLLTVFFDVGELDYIDLVVSPDGRKGKMLNWHDSDKVNQPDQLLYEEDKELYLKLEKMLVDLK